MKKSIALSIVLAVLVVGLFGLHPSSAASVQQIGSASLYIFGVTNLSGTPAGIPSLLSLTVTEGTGQVFLGSVPLVGNDTQAQAVVSASVACQLVNVNCDDYNFYYYIQSSSPAVSGPSAGAAFAIAAMSVLTNKPLNPAVAMTGTANPDGSVGLVGDVGPKSMAAADQGIKLFLYPAYEPNIPAYEQITDNITQQALNYDTAHGMAAVAVSSLYAAYQYFTGYNITPMVDYNVTTPLYNSLMQATYNEFNTYQQGIYDSLPSKNSSDPLVTDLINAALIQMRQETTLAANGDYYTAASYIINSSSTLLYAKTLEESSLQSNSTNYMDGLVSAENASIQNTYNDITKNYVTNRSTLDLKFIAIDRLAQASRYLEDSNSYIASNMGNAAYFYALSEVKRASSLFWLSVVPKGTSSFSESQYYNLSQYYLYKASSYTDYANLLNPNANLFADYTSMQQFFGRAQTYQAQGMYIPSIFDSLEAIATAELIIEENSIDINGSASAVTNQILLSALRIINNAEDSLQNGTATNGSIAGITPFLGISYYAFAKNFENTSLPLLIQYASYSRVYTDFEASLANASFVQHLSVFQPINVPAPFNVQYILYLILGTVLGIALGGIIYEYKLFKLIKNRRIGKNIKIVVKTKHAKKKKKKNKK